MEELHFFSLILGMVLDPGGHISIISNQVPFFFISEYHLIPIFRLPSEELTRKSKALLMVFWSNCVHSRKVLMVEEVSGQFMMNSLSRNRKSCCFGQLGCQFSWTFMCFSNQVVALVLAELGWMSALLWNLWSFCQDLIDSWLVKLVFFTECVNSLSFLEFLPYPCSFSSTAPFSSHFFQKLIQ